MTDVCINCHEAGWIGNFYTQYDAFIDLYNTKYAIPGKALYTLAKPLLNPVQFSNKLDYTWYELWHHEGRRARHGVSMMAPDYAHWHGTYEVSKRFYMEFVPELRELIDQNKASSDPARAKAAAALSGKLDEVLNSDDHKWFLGKMDASEAAERAKQVEDFRKRYELKPQTPAAAKPGDAPKADSPKPAEPAPGKP